MKSHEVSFNDLSGQKTLTMFVGVVLPCCVLLITECHNSYNHCQSPLTNVAVGSSHDPVQEKKHGFAIILQPDVLSLALHPIISFHIFIWSCVLTGR